jgi:hypothetical protein
VFGEIEPKLKLRTSSRGDAATALLERMAT